MDFFVDGVDQGPSNVSASGVAKDVYTWGNNGNGGTTLQTSNTVTATYNGDDTAGDFSSSASSNYSVTEGKDTTLTTISGATTVVFNQKILYTATIAATGVGAPGFPVDGTVMFSIDGGAGVPEPITNGVATFDPPHWGNPASGGALHGGRPLHR